MRTDLPFLVMRLAPMMTRPYGPRRVTVDFRASSLRFALSRALAQRELGRTAPEWNPWRQRAVYWVVYRRAPAHRGADVKE